MKLLLVILTLIPTVLLSFPYQNGPIPEVDSKFDSYSAPIPNHAIIKSSTLLSSTIKSGIEGLVDKPGEDYPQMSYDTVYWLEMTYQLELSDASNLLLEIRTFEYKNIDNVESLKNSLAVLPGDELDFEFLISFGSTKQRLKTTILRNGKKAYPTLGFHSSAEVTSPYFTPELGHLGIAYARENTYLRKNLDVEGRENYIPEVYFSSLLYTFTFVDGTHQKLWMLNQMFDQPPASPLFNKRPLPEIPFETLTNYEAAVEFEKYPSVPSGKIKISKVDEKSNNEILYLAGSSKAWYGPSLLRITANAKITLSNKQVLKLNRELVTHYKTKNIPPKKGSENKPQFNKDDTLELTPLAYVLRGDQRGRVVEVHNLNKGVKHHWILWKN